MNMHTSMLDTMALRTAFSHFPSGVVAIGARHNDENHALVAAAFNVGISLEPALVSVAIQNSSSTWPILKNAPELGISVFAEHQKTLCYQISGKDKSKRFDNVELSYSVNNAMYLPEASLYFTCEIYAEYPAGDHTMVLLKVKSFSTGSHEPIVFHKSSFTVLEKTQ
ncbi:flavin reductase family protein [Acinetobacter sp. ANC 3813]|uniref:flavin reductase family protein n=1 Tax=Acinetobacter sp. ANC 3813 TaxID=1977873 RepID=UPI00148A9506|nr:flavin reductase family protein [Acinetobacter sp. ANC 3813]